MCGWVGRAVWGVGEWEGMSRKELKINSGAGDIGNHKLVNWAFFKSSAWYFQH